ncbi:MAG TPA: PQQ-binding-like beta-propeller repeat protein [Ktedonobacteraceae bacterium]|jgi:outer membrane protein assembly factor BamB
MHEDNDSFTPEQVDEQVTQLSTNSLFATQEATTQERLVRELRATYGAEQETAQAVEHVWQRLEKSHGHLMHYASPSPKTQASDIRSAQSERALSMEQSQKRKRWQIIGALAAALLLVILASGLVSLVAKNHAPTAGTSVVSTQQPTRQPTPTAIPAANLYVTASTIIYKLDPATGKIKWYYQAGKDPNTYNITYTSIVLNNTVYFADQSSTLYALNAQTGVLKWKLPAQSNDTLEHPMTDGTTLYIHSNNQGVCSVDTQAGKILHCYANLNPSIVSQGIFYGFDPASNTFNKTSIYAFDPTQNKKLWEQSVPIHGQGFQEMNYAHGTLYATSETTYDKLNIPPLSSYIYAYNAQSGALIWKSGKVASDLILRPPAVANGTVYFGSQDGSLGALSATTGQPRWITGSNGRVYPTPATADGVVYMGVTDNGSSSSGAYIIALNSTHGTEIWKHSLHLYMGSQLLLNNGVLYVGTSDGKLHALHASDGSEIWHTTLNILNNPLSFMSGQDDLLLAP